MSSSAEMSSYLLPKREHREQKDVETEEREGVSREKIEQKEEEVAGGEVGFRETASAPLFHFPGL